MTGYGLNADRIPVVLASACYLADADWKCLWDTMPSAPVLPDLSGTLGYCLSPSRLWFEVTLNMFDFLPFENDFLRFVQIFVACDSELPSPRSHLFNRNTNMFDFCAFRNDFFEAVQIFLLMAALP